MRNKYTIEFEKALIEKSKIYTKKELLKYALKKFDYDISIDAFNRYLSRHKIRCIDYNPNKAIGNNKLGKEIGSEWHRKDGMILIKTEDGWIYKQRYIYEKHHGKLDKKQMVIFLDGNRNNYDIDNLMAVDTKEYLYARNKNLLSNNSEVTKTAILSARLNYKTKEIIKNENIK